MSDRRTEYSPSHNHCKRTIIPRPAPTLPKPHYPLLRTITLASLVKGRWIDGKAQALILLLSACDMPTIFMLQTFCRQDGGIALHPPTSPFPQPSQKAHQPPRLALSPLPLNERSVCFASLQLWSQSQQSILIVIWNPLYFIKNRLLTHYPYPPAPFPQERGILLGLPPLDPVRGYAPATPFSKII